MKLDLSLVKFSLLDTKFLNAGILERTKAIKSSSNLTSFYFYFFVRLLYHNFMHCNSDHACVSRNSPKPFRAYFPTHPKNEDVPTNEILREICFFVSVS